MKTYAFHGQGVRTLVPTSRISNHHCFLSDKANPTVSAKEDHAHDHLGHRYYNQRDIAVILLLPGCTSLGLLMCQPAFEGLRIPLLATNSRASPIFVFVGLFDVFILVVASIHFVLAFLSRRLGRFWTNFGRLSLFISLSFIFLRMWIVHFKPEVINDPLNPVSVNIDGTKGSTRTWVVRTILNCAFKLFIEPSSPLSLS